MGNEFKQRIWGRIAGLIGANYVHFIRPAYPARDDEIGKFDFRRVRSPLRARAVFTLGLELGAEICFCVWAFTKQSRGHAGQILCMQHSSFAIPQRPAGTALVGAAGPWRKGHCRSDK